MTFSLLEAHRGSLYKNSVKSLALRGERKNREISVKCTWRESFPVHFTALAISRKLHSEADPFIIGPRVIMLFCWIFFYIINTIMQGTYRSSWESIWVCDVSVCRLDLWRYLRWWGCQCMECHVSLLTLLTAKT